MFSFLRKYFFYLLTLSMAILALYFFSREILFPPSPKVVFLDVGQGDSILIMSPHGRVALIDSGKYENIGEKVARYLPIGKRNIDLLIATHPDLDHIGGMTTLLDEFQIGKFIYTDLLAGSPVYRELAQKVREYHIDSHQGKAGEKIWLDDNFYLRILYPPFLQKGVDANDMSLVIKLDYGGQSFLFTGDASKNVEKKLIAFYPQRVLHSDILKLGHHGSRNSSGKDFLRDVHPQYGVISVACHNSYGHPHIEVLKNLDELGIKELNTCKDGDIIFSFRHGKWLLKKEKERN